MTVKNVIGALCAEKYVRMRSENVGSGAPGTELSFRVDGETEGGFVREKKLEGLYLAEPKGSRTFLSWRDILGAG